MALKIGVVGPCGAGKSTLVAGLGQHGYDGRHIAQEHSYVQDMWQRLTRPDLLIFLEVSYPLTRQRRQMDWSEMEYMEQIRRLQHARQNADLVINTDEMDPRAILKLVLEYLQKFDANHA